MRIEKEGKRMCDYSLMAIPNRLAVEREDLVAHRFATGSMGLASPADLRRLTEPRGEPSTLWSAVKNFFSPRRTTPVCAVCIPPGARLRLADIPVRLQTELGVGPEEEVTFTQITAAVNSYRDSVRFSNGRVLRLQELREGQRVRVLDLSCAEVFEPVFEERPELMYRLR
jgi:hypothetical protein